MMLEQFIGHYTNQVISFDQVPDGAGQAVQLVAAWCQSIGLPHHWGTPRQWWSEDDPAFDRQWFLHEYDEQEVGRPEPGDIVVFSPDLPGSGGEGHLSIFVNDEDDPQEWTGFDAAWGGMSAHLQSHNWAYVVGWFTPTNPSVLEAFTPTPIAPSIPSGSYDFDLIEAQEVTVTAERALSYNLNDVSWNSFLVNTIDAAFRDAKVEVKAIAKHRLGGVFLMPDPLQPEGYRVEDTNYVLPEPESSKELVSIRPESEQKKNSLYAPLASPAVLDTIQLTKSVPGYRSVSDAILRRNPVKMLDVNEYYIYKHGLEGMVNVTYVPGKVGHWMNPNDLIENPLEQDPGSGPNDPAPDWRQSFIYLTDRLNDSHMPVYYQPTANTMVVDLEGNRPPLPLNRTQKILIAGFFTGPDGLKYAAPQLTVDRNPPQWYGVLADVLQPMRTFEELKEVVDDHVEEVQVSPLQIRTPLQPEPTPVLPLHVKIYLLVKNFKLVKALKERYKEINNGQSND